MIDYRENDEIIKIAEKFGVFDLTFVERVNAGPDEELYFLKDKEGNEYGIWERDYMSELDYEKSVLEKEFKVFVDEWLKADGEETYDDGESFAMFKMKEK